MAITRESKEKQVGQLVEQLGASKLTVVANYKGLSVAELQALRAELKIQDSNLRVIKKTLLKLGLSQVIALKDLKDSQFEGMVALAFGFSDDVAPAQVLAKFAKTHPQLEILAAIDQEGHLLPAVEVMKLATLPSREILHAQLVGVLVGPKRGLVAVLGANLRGLMQVLNGIAQKSV